MTPILVIGDAGAPTGFARVIRSVFERLRDEFAIHQLATRYRPGGEPEPWPIYPAAERGDLYGFNRVEELVAKVRPRLVFLLYDLPFQGRYLEALRAAGGTAKVVGYGPVDAGPIVPELIERLEGIDRLVLFTDYGRREVERALDGLRRRRPDFAFAPLAVIPHGLDGGRFHPLAAEDWAAGRALARQRLFPDDAELRDAFLVLNANRNSRRKRIDVTMGGFAAFAADKPAGVKLLLHMAREGDGWHLPSLARRLGIEDRLILTTGEDAHPSLSDAELNTLYNACDVGVNTASAEGWGLVSFEHGATGAAQVVPDHTSPAELWRGAAELLPVAMTVTEPGDLTEAHLVTPLALAQALGRLYRDAEYRGRLGRAAFANAHRSEYRWDGIAERWRLLLREMLAES